jgi:EmrB/QacA subfamily drug resistance transporter
LVLAVCCLSVLLVSLDTTILNVALPSIQEDLHSSVSGLQWTLDAYTIVLASLLILAGSTADRVGRRRVFLLGLVSFTGGSALCSLAPSLHWLIVFRMAQAVGGCMLTPVAMAILANAFPGPRERARAIGVWGGVVGVSMAAGPILGGVLVQAAGWRSVFWLNVPIGLAALLLTTLFVPESRAPRPRRVDPVGQLLVITALGTLTYAIIEAPGRGWTSPAIVICLITAAGALAAFIPYEKRRDEPLVDPRLFRSAPFSGATVMAVCAFTALGGFLFANTLYLQQVLGLSALSTGVHLLPMAVLSLVCCSPGPASPPAACWPSSPPDPPTARTSCSTRRTHCSDWASASSTRPSPTPRSRACRAPRPEWPPRSPRPAARSAPRSASR